MPSQEPDYFALLGVSPEATEQEIRQAFRLRAAIIRPDRFDPQANPAEFQKANEMLRDLNEAYKALKDRARRSAQSARQPSATSAALRTRSSAQQKRTRSSRRRANAGTTDQSTAHRRARSKAPPEAADAHAPLSGGRTSFASLAPPAREFLLKRQSSAVPGEFRHETDSPILNYIAVLVPLAWFWYLFAQTEGDRWSGTAWLWYLAGSIAALWMTAYNLMRVIRWHTANLKSYFYLTPLYFVFTEYDQVSFWPIWELKDLKVKHDTKEGKYQSSQVTMVFDDSQESITFTSLESLESLGHVYTNLRERAAEAASDGNTRYFMTHDLFRGCRRETEPAKADRTPAWSGAIALAAGIIVFWLADAANRSYASNPPRHEYPPVVAEEPAESQRGTTPIDPTPRRTLSLEEFERLLQEQAALDPRTEPFSEPEQPVPPNGSVARFHAAAAVAPLEIVTRDDQHYFVKLSRWDDDSREILTMFVRAGERAETTVPLGLYRIKYATGRTWYGPNHLFGWATRYFKADSPFHFRQSGNEISGYTVELYLQSDGNLRTKPIPPKEW